MAFTFTQLGSMGRLGNMMAQCACVIGTALNHNDSYIFPHWKYENSFNLKNCFRGKILPTEKYIEPFFHFQNIEINNSTNKIVDLVGYFQSYKYWEKHEDLIKSILMPINPLPIQRGKTSIHIRRGDYLNFQDCHPIQTLQYYIEAMKIVPSEKYVIFSDDINWCKQNFVGDNFEFSEHQNEIDDLRYMISMENQIIANSSFSWWAAYLNTNPSKKIIAPKNWFGSKLNHDTKDLCPSDWIRL